VTGSRLRIHGNQQGLTYLEILIAGVLLATALVPALDALRASVSGTSVHESYVTEQHRLATRLEEVLAEPFGQLNDAANVAGGPVNPTTYSEPVATPGRMLVFIARYDGDNADADGDPFTGTDDGLLWVRTAIEATEYSLESLIAQ